MIHDQMPHEHPASPPPEDNPESNLSSLSDSGCLGCLWLILFIWVLCFGMVIEGTHYVFGCDGLAPEIRIDKE